MKFGAELSSPCQVVAVESAGGHLKVRLSRGPDIMTRSVVVATGARYRSLSLPEWTTFEGAGIYYAATDLEGHACAGQPVAVIGGANSAGQAALFLAARGCAVTLVTRGNNLGARMSAYLMHRLEHDPRVDVQASTEVTGLRGDAALASVVLTRAGSQGPEVFERACRGLFCFIGAAPATEWLNGVELDARGFIRTDVQLDRVSLGSVWSGLGRAPLPFETSIPTVFAAGDVRVGSMKRVAAAVGEGASAIRSVHTAIGLRG